MLAKMTVKNQITLPKAVVRQFEGVEYFEVSTEGTSIVLRPLRRSRADEVRQRLGELGISELDLTDAIQWSREDR
jgi:bifunctional DNA-binding transcriptional regulator/antitoxin component of YhaV-PrlF toxin-antitoxin module